jgi:RNA polymerase sigma-70 factor (ECF subfamily)
LVFETVSDELPTISDEELARETQAGSLGAFEVLVFRYEHRVLAFVSQFCRNPPDARDVTQDTFVKAFQSIGQFNSSRAFAPWLFTIARRKCIDRHRSTPAEADAVVPNLTDDADPSVLAARREDGQDLWRLARQRLSVNQFQALWLHYAEDMEVAQIAQALGKTRVHIKVILFRARQILARELNSASAPGKATPKTGSQPILPVRKLTRERRTT